MQPPTPAIVVLIPVFNDWKSLSLLLGQLDETLSQHQMQVEVLAVDDASTAPVTGFFILEPFKAIREVRILTLRRNLGHQRAIAVGLAYVEANHACQAVVVMDGDGEDTPIDVVRLIACCQQENYEKVVFARRSQRSESWLFRMFYLLYKGSYKLLTGQSIRVGNFSIIPYQLLRRLVAVSEIWNHYAAGVYKAKLPCLELPTKRGYRLSGKSKMNFVLLITHGLSAISVYGDIVGVRLLVTSCLLILVTIGAMVAIVAIRLLTALAVPGWASYLLALCFVILIQAFMASLSFIFIVLAGRNNTNFLPERDYHYFVLELQHVFSAQ